MFEMSGIFIFLAGYLFGAVSAYVFLRQKKQLNFEPKQVERLFILTIVTAVWGVSNAYAIFNVDYVSPNALHALFGAVVGFYFDIAIFDKFGLGKKGK